ncbi:44907_t:CDS:2, partial [Gigaspora margarita]
MFDAILDALFGSIAWRVLVELEIIGWIICLVDIDRHAEVFA